MEIILHDLKIRAGNDSVCLAPGQPKFMFRTKMYCAIYAGLWYLPDRSRWQGVTYLILKYVEKQKCQNIICLLCLSDLDRGRPFLRFVLFQDLSPKSLLDKLSCTDHTGHIKIASSCKGTVLKISNPTSSSKASTVGTAGAVRSKNNGPAETQRRAVQCRTGFAALVSCRFLWTHVHK